jgi:hypothetical protein
MSEKTHGQALYELWCEPDEGLKRYWHFLSVTEQGRWERLAESIRTTIQMTTALQHIPVEEDDEELIVAQPEESVKEPYQDPYDWLQGKTEDYHKQSAFELHEDHPESWLHDNDKVLRRANSE